MCTQDMFLTSNKDNQTIKFADQASGQKYHVVLRWNKDK